jgi:hypothetical protein
MGYPIAEANRWPCSITIGVRPPPPPSACHMDPMNCRK